MGDAAVDEYLDALAKETVRTRPVVLDVGRVLTRPVELAGCRVELSTTTSAERQRVIACELLPWWQLTLPAG
jgi:hypothetical protein